MREGRIETSETLLRHRILELERRRLAAGEDRRDVLVMRAPEWINAERSLRVLDWLYAGR